MTARQYIAAIGVCLLSSYSGFGSANDPLEVRVVTESYPPYNYLDNDQVVGLSTEIVRKVMDRSGLNYSIELYPWTRAYAMATRGDNRNVLIFTLRRTEAREAIFDWLVKLSSSDLYLATRSDHPDLTDDQLRNGDSKATCVRDDAACESLARLGFTEDRLQVVSDPASEIRLVALGRADYFIANPVFVPLRLRQLNLPADSFREVKLVETGGGYYLGAAKSVAPTIRQKIHEVVAAFATEGDDLKIVLPH
ncbi:substrate-binding periplasmic protein [Aestuariirhabdus sp. LZHN29]|uniref:substrate-binding periplasmic protein n=1 Tax=Aestuariirhabdus sp. LZHN29 TaxID=3417462 RepID=UPI003CEF7CA3